jgi:hypothetical protein
MSDQASYVNVHNPVDIAGDIPVQDYLHAPDRRNPDDDSRRIQQTTALHRAAVAAQLDESSYTGERVLIGLDNLDLVTEGRHQTEIAQVKVKVRNIIKAEKKNA